VSLTLLLIIGCGSDPTATPTQRAPEAAPTATPTPDPWQAIEAAAKAEGSVIFVASSENVGWEEILKGFESKYGIKTSFSVIRTGDFAARIEAEFGANNVSTDVYSSGGGAQLSKAGFTQRVPQMPMMDEPDSSWIYDPFIDWKSGKTDVIFADMSPNYMLVNNELCPVGSCVESYKDLSDPKWKGELLMVEPIGVTTGSFIMGFLHEEYGEEWSRAVVSNIGATIRGTKEGEAMIARGEFPIFVTGKAPKATQKLPPPRPLRAVRPSDGLIPSISGPIVPKNNPHPNAAFLLVNYMLTQEAQQLKASVIGEGFIRTDVKAFDPDLMQLAGNIFPTAPTSPEFQGRFPTYTDMWQEELEKSGLR
jgi:iron(III) transport system substrate-binding protein